MWGLTGRPAAFIFANLNGTISAWNPTLGAKGTVPAVTEVTTPGASYTGLAIDSTTGHLFAATATGINVFNSSFQAVSTSYRLQGYDPVMFPPPVALPEWHIDMYWGAASASEPTTSWIRSRLSGIGQQIRLTDE
jgi:hypothetical protein